MTRRYNRVYGMNLFLGLAGLMTLVVDPAHAARKPNVIVIIGDDMGYADIGAHGGKEIPTPHIDALAGSGVRMTRGYVSGPYCSPTRAGLLTGRYQQRFGHEFNPSGSGAGLPLTEVTMADRLRAVGYATGLIGKWHLGSAPQFRPQKRGFDEFFGFLSGSHGYFPPKGSGPGGRILRGNKPALEKEYLTDAFAREALGFIDRNAKRPFFLTLAFNAVHTPMHASDKYLARFAQIQDERRRTYAAMMSAMDDAIGAVMGKLRAARIEEQTLVFFFSDNGGPTVKGTTINGSINAPLRGSKRQTLEGGIRVPFIVRWKGRLPAGKVYERPVIQLDVLPTALAAAGVAAPKSWKLDGVDLLPYLEGKNAEAPHAALTWRFGRQMAVIQGDSKLVRFDDHPAQLYDLGSDIGESRDLIAERADDAKRLQAAWERWDADLAKPLWQSGRKK